MPSSVLGELILGNWVLGDLGAGVTPPLGQTVDVDFIPSTALVFTPGVRGADQEVDPDFIADTSAVFTPLVAHNQIVNPSFIASTSVVFEPTLKNAPKKVIPGFIASVSRVFAPALVGGAQGLQLFIGGKSTPHLQVATTSFTSNISGRWSGSLTLIDADGTWDSPPLLPADDTRGTGVTIVVTENSVRKFFGFIKAITCARAKSTNITSYRVDMIDMGGLFDHRFLTVTYTAGTDIADVLRDLNQRIFVAEGITIHTIPAAIDTLDSDLVYNESPVTKILDDLANLETAAWWVDVFGDLKFQTIDEMETAPFAIVEPTIAHPELTSFWRNLKVTVDISTYRNLQKVLSNLNINPNAIPSITETITLPQPKAAALGFRLAAVVLRYTPTAIQKIEVNYGSGFVEEPWQNGYTNALFNLDKSWWSILNDGPYLYGPDAAETSPVPPLGFPYPPIVSPFPVSGNVLRVTYIPNVTNSVLVSQATLGPPTDLQLAGSGIWEAVEQVNDISDPDSMDAIAQALLARKGRVPFLVSYETDKPGLAVGQRQSIDLPKGKIPSTVVTITSLTENHMIVDLGFGTGFRVSVDASDGVELDRQIKYLERLYQRTQHPLPIVQYEYASFVLAPGGSIVGGTVASNPQITTRTGKMVDVYAQAGVPPTDQDLYIDIVNSDYGSIFGSPVNRIKIRAGYGGVVKTTLFLYDPAPTIIIVGQSLTVVTEYIQTGSNPARAGSVSVVARWAL